MSFCVCVLKDLANHLTNMVLLHKVGSHRAREGLGKGTTTLPKEIAPRKKDPPKNFLIKKEEFDFPPASRALEDSRGITTSLIKVIVLPCSCF